MATTKPITNQAPRRSRKRYWLLALMLCSVLAVLLREPIAGYARTGASYGARVACSCRYAGGRSLADCAKDFEPGMELVSLSDNPEAKSVTARFALVYAQTATYREGEGCVLERWES